MANPEHLEILSRGVDVWNNWRIKQPIVCPDLRGANLNGARLNGIMLKDAYLRGSCFCGAHFYGSDLRGADLRDARLSDACLIEARLCGADLRRTNLVGANLSGADFLNACLDDAGLSDAILSDAKLRGTSLRGALMRRTLFHRCSLLNANLSRADLSGADLSGADLSGADLSGADLRSATIKGTALSRAKLNNAATGNTSFVHLNLSSIEGLTSVRHSGPSEVSITTILKSQGNIPEKFLRGCGVPDEFIIYIHSLIAASQPIQFYSCFISYSSEDQSFSERLHGDLQSKGVRCWFAPEDLKIGAEIRVGIDESIRLHDKLLLVLSETSVKSRWVEQEVETALTREREQHRTMLFPIRLDDTVMKIDTGWPALIKNTRNIGDFRKRGNPESYQIAFDRLLRDLKAEEKKP
jgi:uncharacterized protein YjbI with pentapeptide repeats